MQSLKDFRKSLGSAAPKSTTSPRNGTDDTDKAPHTDAAEASKASVRTSLNVGKIGKGWLSNTPGAVLKRLEAGPYTSPLSQLNLSSCVSVTTQLIPLIHSGVLKLS